VGLSSAIMAHPARAAFVDELRAGELAGVPVVWDERSDRWDTGRRSMLAFDPAATWHVVVQDDAIVCRDFLAGVELALGACEPSGPVAFYTGRVRPARVFVEGMVCAADELGRRWLEFEGPWWGVAVAVPTAMIPAMVEWGDRNTKIPNYDRRMAAHFDLIGATCRYSHPSLVDHRVGGENPSLVPGRGNAPSRTAFRFIGDESPLSIDWNTPAVTPADRRLRARTKRTWRHRATGRVRTTVLGSDADLRYASLPAEWKADPRGY